MFFFPPSSSSFFSQITKSKEEEEEEVDDAVDRKSDTANENGHNRELSLTRCDRRCVTQFVKKNKKKKTRRCQTPLFMVQLVHHQSRSIFILF